MKKLKLKLEDLQLESFDTTPEGQANRGTVFGFAPTDQGWTCGGQAGTCEGFTCYYGCNGWTQGDDTCNGGGSCTMGCPDESWLYCTIWDPGCSYQTGYTAGEGACSPCGSVNNGCPEPTCDFNTGC